MNMFLQACVNGLLMGGFYSLMGMGQNIIFGVMKIVNFCHGEMLMVGMYLTFILYTFFGIDPYLAVPMVAAVMFVLGAGIQHTLITPVPWNKEFYEPVISDGGTGIAAFQRRAGYLRIGVPLDPHRLFPDLHPHGAGDNLPAEDDQLRGADRGYHCAVCIPEIYHRGKADSSRIPEPGGR